MPSHPQTTKRRTKTTRSPKQQSSKSSLKGIPRIKHFIQTKSADYLSRRPHRSFRLTKRRDYVRSLAIPGYWALTAEVWHTLRRNKRLFGGVLLFYGVLDALFVGLASQSVYDQLSSLFGKGSDIFAGGWGAVGQASVIVLSGITGSFNPQLSQAQQIYGFILSLLTWLTTVWLLRALAAGKHPRFRDALYNAGSPIVATALVVIILIIQLIPAALAVLAMNIAISTDLFQSGLIAMLVTVAAVVLLILSVYWSISTFIALVIVTLPGMYPWQAIRAAGDIAIGRRIRILLRLGWLLLSDLVLWVVIVLPVVLLDRWIKGILPALHWLPLVPVAILIVSSFAVIWSAAYIYLLYRKVVEDDANPA